MPKLIVEEFNHELLDHISKSRDSHNDLMTHLHEIKKHLPADKHDEFNQSWMHLVNHFGRIKDLANKHVTKG